MKIAPSFLASCVVVSAFATASFAGTVGSINSVNLNTYIFSDFADSELTVTNNYPVSVSFAEQNFGDGGPFANRHSAYFSNTGNTNYDFNYEDAFDICVTYVQSGDQPNGREAGIHADLFGLGYFGGLPNGEIAAFGSLFPFHSFGVDLYTPGDEISVRMIHRPGSGDGVNTLPDDGVRSTFEYLYSINGGSWTSSGLKEMGSGEGGIPSNFDFHIGFGVQNTPGLPTETVFSEIKILVPSPGMVAMAGVFGLAGLRRRR